MGASVSGGWMCLGMCRAEELRAGGGACASNVQSLPPRLAGEGGAKRRPLRRGE